MSPHPHPSLTRRAAVATTTAGAAAAVLVLPGCDVGDLSGPGGSPSNDPAIGSGTDDEEADATIVDEVRVELDEVLALVTGLHQRPMLRRSTQALLALHSAHREVLAESASELPTPVAPTGAPAELWAMLVRRERDSQRRLADWSLAARSGTLARLLASMSAGIAAHLAAAPAPAEGAR